MSKVALVTGGSRGLGRDMALNLAKKGFDVALTYLSNEAKAAEVVKEIEALGQKAIALQLDSSDTSSFDSFYATLSQKLQALKGSSNFDCLINNAGIALYTPIVDTTEEQFDSVMNIHIKGVFFLTQKALPFLNDGGSIVNISTGLTRFAFPGYGAYASVKGAVEVFTRYLAKELGERRINVNSIAPGAIETDFGGGFVRDNTELNQFIASQTALGRVGLPTDIGPVVAFLCTEEAKWINGQRIELSGGQNL